MSGRSGTSPLLAEPQAATTGAPQPADPDEQRLWQLAAGTLTANWVDGHTVPSRTLYPHQWSWDSGFIAIGLAHVAPARAWHELRSLFAAQWADGRVPHIVFDPATTADYFPGPRFWNSAAVPGTPAVATSGIVQPPLHAFAAWRVAQRLWPVDPVATRAELGLLYPRLVAQQRYLFQRRDVGGGGLACIVHPWESGLDNSPAFDRPLAAVAADLTALEGHRRHDIVVADASHRPTDLDYARYVLISEAYREHGYADRDLLDRHPFLVECPLFNALAAAAEHALAEIAELIGADPGPHRERAAAITGALVRRLYDPVTGTFHARDLRTDRLVPAHTAAGLVPLILPDLPERQVESVLAEACSARFELAERMSQPLPSHDRTAPEFHLTRYWRGPSWMNISWLLWYGLRLHHRTALAAGLRGSMIDLVRRSGCHEYFHPRTGDGLGAPAFSWTAALLLDVLAAN